MRIRCTTQFDITATGVAGNHSRNRLPFQDASGEDIRDLEQWNRSRNRQRNWETVLQVLNLRTLLDAVDPPTKVKRDDRYQWQFEFEIDRASSVSLGDDPLGVLKLDCNGVPMILGLDETPGISNYLVYDENIKFEVINK